MSKVSSSTFPFKPRVGFAACLEKVPDAEFEAFELKVYRACVMAYAHSECIELAAEERARARATYEELRPMMRLVGRVEARRERRRRPERRPRKPKSAPIAKVTCFRNRAAPRAHRAARRSLAARAGSSGDDDGGGDPDPGLRRLQRTRAWALLPWSERQRIVRLLVEARCLEPLLRFAAEGLVDGILADAALARGEAPPVGDLWLTATIPTGTVMVRDAGGVWRLLQYPPDSTAGAEWQTWGCA
jgi:hypothetical protein